MVTKEGHLQNICIEKSFVEGGGGRQALTVNSSYIVSHWSKFTPFQLPYISGLGRPVHLGRTSSSKVRPGVKAAGWGTCPWTRCRCPYLVLEGAWDNLRWRDGHGSQSLRPWRGHKLSCSLVRKWDKAQESCRAEHTWEAPKSGPLCWGKHRSWSWTGLGSYISISTFQHVISM